MLFFRFILFTAFFGITSIDADLAFNNAKCLSHDKTFLKFEYCFLKSANRSYKYFSLKAILYQLPIRNAKATFTILRRDTRTVYEHLNGSINICKFLRGGQNPIARFILSTFLPYSNINHTCPFNHDIILDKLPVHYVNAVIKNFIADGRYLMNVTWSVSDIPRADVTVYFTKS